MGDVYSPSIGQFDQVMNLISCYLSPGQIKRSSLFDRKTPLKLSLLENLRLSFRLATVIECLPEVTQSLILFVRDNWNSFSEEEKGRLRSISNEILRVRDQRPSFKRAILFRMYVLIPSIVKGVDLYKLFVESTIQLAESIANIIESWDEINSGLLEAHQQNAADFDVFADDDDDAVLLLNRKVSQKEVVNWGPPRGAEIW